MIKNAKRHNTMQDVLNAIATCVNEIHHEDCTADEFDKLSGHIYRLIEKVIYRCLGNLSEARKRLQHEGLEAYLDIYLELQNETA